MKKFNKTPKKSWSIDLVQIADDLVDVCAVDSTTGEKIAHLIGISGEGVRFCASADLALIEQDYDPNQYGNKWDERGKLRRIDE